jgi:sirohydrochlorin ferrochelatase
VRVVRQSGSTEAAPPQLAEPGSERRWSQLQALRRGRGPLEVWIEALDSGALTVAADLLAAIWSRLGPAAAERLLAGSAAAEAEPWLRAGLQELPAMASRRQVSEIWLEPLLRRHAAAAAEAGVASPEALAWLQLLGLIREARVAHRLREQVMALTAAGFRSDGSDAMSLIAGSADLLPLLGLQRDPIDAALLLRLALAPAPRSLRRAALEGLALGLSSWPVAPLTAGLQSLATDLDPGLAAVAVDLLARLPNPTAALRSLLDQPLDPGVRDRLRRRIRTTPLVLLVHGRQDGVIPAVLQDLASELASRRGAPVLIQALTADQPDGDPCFWEAVRRAGSFSLVPLLLLPGAHVRQDLPAIAAAWRERACPSGCLRTLPFLGAWPHWQQALASVLAEARRRAAPHPGAPPVDALWLHHPLEGSLAPRYLAMLAAVLAAPGLAAPYTEPTEALKARPADPLVLLPLTLAANRLSESLADRLTDASSPFPGTWTLLPPLLEIPALRQHLLSALEALP